LREVLLKRYPPYAVKLDIMDIKVPSIPRKRAFRYFDTEFLNKRMDYLEV